MTKQELAAKIAEDTGLTKVTAWAVVESALDGIVKALKRATPSPSWGLAPS